MRSKKKIGLSALGGVLLAVTVFSAYRTYDAYVEKEMENGLLLENAEALALNEGPEQGVRTKSLNNDEPCTVKEAYVCYTGFTIPDWVPYIGGTVCKIDYVDEVEFPGTQNLCFYTGNEKDYCNFYTCWKN